ncbi:P-loop containing nucleoside triphosphate hydrolase protein [Anaeromyces robustus]|uniref:p-loop containing nucleoside triphosphate hydrolase protein n=1 Tax=Anaeromyces robustus TaxID=1754192 RepID=A0A1Y1X4A7_9FUNG|nr:P-loop containing nucleoside triphosphate hydrolase protein [Anaeromyces robustus]|eukprot:ORX80639.1 P-loop containing nucleoside triphosphate hydrolase protein [Anaeromyces robustus]
MYHISLSNNFISEILYLWVYRLIYLIKSKDFTEIKFHLGKKESSKKTGKDLHNAWKEEVEKHQKDPSIAKALMRAYGKGFGLLAIWEILWIFFAWTGFYWLVKQSIRYIEHHKKGKDDEIKGYVISVAFLLTFIFSTICHNQLHFQSTKIGIRVRSGLMVLIYRKLLTLSALTNGMGNIVNLISNDCNRIAEVCVNLHYCWSSLLEAILICILAYIEIGKSAFPAIALIIVIFIPLQIYFAIRTSSLAYESTKNIKDRVRLMSEILTVIKLIKFYAWERFFEDNVNKVREKEVRKFKQIIFSRCKSLIVVFVAPMISTLFSLVCYYVIRDKAMSPAITFTILSIFNSLRYPLSMLPTAIRSIGDALISIKKIDNFFVLPETYNNGIENYEILDGDKQDVAIFMKDAKFSYDNELPLKLGYLNMMIRKGDRIAVVGEIATCVNLMDALLGQLILQSGTAYLNGKLGFIAQQPWIIKGSLCDNIILGAPYDEILYNQVLTLTFINYDVARMDPKDLNDISDETLNLSDNFKQRVCIARCLYSQPDIVILDDPFLSFENPIEGLLYKNCIEGFLKDKTVIMFTHDKKYLKLFDVIMIMDNGSIIECDTYDQLKKLKVIQLQNDILNLEEDNTEQQQQDLSLSEIDLQSNIEIDNELTVSHLQMLKDKEYNEQTKSKAIENNHTFINGSHRPKSIHQDTVYKTIEQNQMTIHTVNSVTMDVYNSSEENIPLKLKYLEAYKNYIKTTPGSLLTQLVIVVFFLVHAIRFVSDCYLKYFIDEKYSKENILIYAIFAAALIAGVFLRGLFFCRVILKKSVAYHNGILKAILNAPMIFFANTPLSTILTAFAKHLFLVDEYLPESLLQFLYYCPLIVGSIVIVCLFVPYFFVTLPIYVLLIFLILKYSKSVEHRLQIQEGQSKTEIFCHLTTTLDGLRYIKIYQYHKEFEKDYKYYIDINHKYFISLASVQTWKSFNIDLVSSIFIFLTALFIVIFKKTNFLFSKSMTPAIAGLSLTNAVSIILYLPWLFRTIYDVHNGMTSCATLQNYTKCIPKEEEPNKEFTKVPKGWPTKGKIKFENVEIRYYRHTLAVLKSISFTIYPKETIGIIGSSGSGKTSLMMGLLRMLDLYEGSIKVDNIDIKDIPLETLRSNIGIIPQEPVLFAGTVRSNLDPFNEHPDNEIWDALRKVSLYDDIQMLPQKLETTIIDNGRNFSLLQCMLFMIARIVVLDNRIVIYDESVVPLDEMAERKIEQIIHTVFKNKTLLIISNKFRHAVKADRVMVMESGKVVEFDTPQNLYMTPNSYLYRLFDQANDPEVLEFKEEMKDYVLPIEYQLEMDEKYGTINSSKNLLSSSVPNSLSSFMNATMPKSLENVFTNPNSSPFNNDTSSSTPSSP